MNNKYLTISKLNEHIKYVSELVKELDKTYQNKKSQQALSSLDSYSSLIENNKLFIKEDSKDTNVLKDLASALVNKYSLDLCFITSVNGEKVTFVCATNGSLNAGQLVKTAAQVCGGNGGGKPTMAQAGGKAGNEEAAVKAVKESL